MMTTTKCTAKQYSDAMDNTIKQAPLSELVRDIQGKGRWFSDAWIYRSIIEVAKRKALPRAWVWQQCRRWMLDITHNGQTILKPSQTKP